MSRTLKTTLFCLATALPLAHRLHFSGSGSIQPPPDTDISDDGIVCLLLSPCDPQPPSAHLDSPPAHPTTPTTAIG
jgi:hypothetical protein